MVKDKYFCETGLNELKNFERITCAAYCSFSNY